MVQLPKTIRLPHEAYANPDRLFHVTMRATIGEKPFASFPTGAAIWQLVLNERERDSIELLGACLMPDHLHALVSPRSKDIIRWVDGFKSWSTRVAQQTRSQRILWQPGFYDRALRAGDLDATIRYIVRNSVAAGLVEEASGWPWVGAWVNG